MPLKKEADFGTNRDGGRNTDYCVHCFVNGKFTMPDITLEQMIEHLALLAPRFGMDEEEARAMAKKSLPGLKRWRKAPKKAGKK
jgi:hypothetical protein